MNLVLYECCNNVVTDVDFKNCVQIQTQKLTKIGDHMAVGTKTPGLHSFLVDIFWNFIVFRRIGHLVEWTNRLCGSSANSGSILFVRNCFLFFVHESFAFCRWKFSMWLGGSAVGSFVLVLFTNPFRTSIGTHMPWVRSPEQL